MPLITKKDVTDLTDSYAAILDSVILDGTLTPEAAPGPLARKITLESLQTCVRDLESRFSNNCNCLVNTDCCQTCQTQTCQSTYCQSSTCQSCQSSKCQSCQRRPNCNCSDCDTH